MDGFVEKILEIADGFFVGLDAFHKFVVKFGILIDRKSVV